MYICIYIYIYICVDWSWWHLWIRSGACCPGQAHVALECCFDAWSQVLGDIAIDLVVATIVSMRTPALCR